VLDALENRDPAFAQDLQGGVSVVAMLCTTTGRAACADASAMLLATADSAAASCGELVA
jgi:hypothetical protein